MISIRYQMNNFPVGANLVFAQGKRANIKIAPTFYYLFDGNLVGLESSRLKAAANHILKLGGNISS
jgi:hypothetical protein